jgi:CRISPR/Cas system-associated endonuclease Cas1
MRKYLKKKTREYKREKMAVLVAALWEADSRRDPLGREGRANKSYFKCGQERHFQWECTRRRGTCPPNNVQSAKETIVGCCSPQ